MSVRLLVCGGRKYSNWDFLYRTLTVIHNFTPVSVLINGGATGADNLGAWWAYYNNVPILTFKAKWDEHGRGAGHIRNTQMIKEGMPTKVAAFQGGKGTENMIKQSFKHGISVTDYRHVL